MKYYSEKEMKSLRREYEKEVLAWPKVGEKKMFGCPGYQVDRKLFSFLVNGGLVLTKLDPEEREQIATEFTTESFHAGKRIVAVWLQVSVKKKGELDRLMPYVKKSYENARKKK